MSADETQGTLPAPTAPQNSDDGTEATQQNGQSQPGKQPWKVPDSIQRRINREVAKRHAAEGRLSALEQESQRLRDELSSLRTANSGGAAPAQPNANQPSRAAPADSRDVNAVAEELVAQRELNDRSNKAFEAGKKEYNDFEDALSTLRNVGDWSDPAEAQRVLQVIVDADEPHKVLYHLGTHPEEASEFFDMTPTQQARYVGKLEARLSGAKPDTSAGDEAEDANNQPSAPASRAPPPIRPVGARGTPTTSTRPSDKDDTATWFRKRNAEIKAKRGR